MLGGVCFLSTFFDKPSLHKSSGLLVVMISLQGKQYICLTSSKKGLPWCYTSTNSCDERTTTQNIISNKLDGVVIHRFYIWNIMSRTCFYPLLIILRRFTSSNMYKAWNKIKINLKLKLIFDESWCMELYKVKADTWRIYIYIYIYICIWLQLFSSLLRFFFVLCLVFHIFSATMGEMIEWLIRQWMVVPVFSQDREINFLDVPGVGIWFNHLHCFVL
jgi:hypothetical protein